MLHQVIEDPQKIEELVEKVREGKRAMNIIIKYNDAFITTCHNVPPSDAASDTRDDGTIWKQLDDNKHPTSLDPRTLYDLPEEERKQWHSNVLNATERHKCQAYCRRKKKRKHQNKTKFLEKVPQTMSVFLL